MSDCICSKLHKEGGKLYRALFSNVIIMIYYGGALHLLFLLPEFSLSAVPHLSLIHGLTTVITDLSGRHL